MADERDDDVSNDEDATIIEMHAGLKDTVLQELTRVQEDLRSVCRYHGPQVGWSIVVAALVEQTGSLAALLIQERPDMRAMLMTRLDELRLYIGTAGTRAQ